ncbi:serine/threonine-protein kinase [Sorangium sp. So ce131]|uniref:serine/threonine-protein kinase n=1 Tax=Sorangium sp. So ce131 TaxID=3133282 RepID=UPI003F634847
MLDPSCGHGQVPRGEPSARNGRPKARSGLVMPPPGGERYDGFRGSEGVPGAAHLVHCIAGIGSTTLQVAAIHRCIAEGEATGALVASRSIDVGSRAQGGTPLRSRVTDTEPAGGEAMLTPSSLGRYRLSGILGRGGMGVVYRGQHADTGEEVAIKTVPVTDRAELAGIRREIYALRRVRHPGIVPILDEGVIGGTPWYAMPLLKGSTLGEHLAARWAGRGSGRDGAGSAALDDATAPMTSHLGQPPRVVVAPPQMASAPALGPLLTLIRRVCAPLAFLHGEGLVHRDLKPGNIFLQADGRPVLIDFGIAAHFGAGGREELDVAPSRGTVEYCAPEQICGRMVDARADLYALGCILYECATGRPPFSGEYVALQHVRERPLPPSLLVPGIPAELERLILRLLEKSPRDRIGHAIDVAAALVAAGAEPGIEDGPRPRAYLYQPELNGRCEEKSKLDKAVQRAASRQHAGLLFIRGESGVGKTRLAKEVSRSAEHLFADSGLLVISGRCTPGAGATPPLDPVAQLLTEVADRARRGGRAAADRLLGRRGAVLAAYNPSLLSLPGQDELPVPPALPPKESRARVIASLCDTIWSLSELLPLVLVLDDIQWADELSLSLLEALAKGGAERPGVLVMATYRSEEERSELVEMTRSPNVTTITLGRLDRSAVAAMVLDMLANEPPWPVVDALVQHSEGNPFFVAEYLRTAIAEGILYRDDAGVWRFDVPPDQAAAALSSLPLPRTLVALIERRLGQLDAEAKALVAQAAIFGQELDGDLLIADAASSTEALDTLRRLQIFEEAPGGRLRFGHDKIREVAYARIPEDERAKLHRRAGEAIEARHGDLPERLPSLAHHFAEAGVHGKASRYLARAAERARDLYANKEAIDFLQRSIRERRQASPEELDLPDLATLHEQLGDMRDRTGDQEKARDAYSAALGAAPGQLQRARLYRKLGKTWEKQEQHTAALELSDRAQAALGDRPTDHADPRWDEWLEIQIERISAHYWLANVKQMRTIVEDIRPVVQAHGTPVQRGRFLHTLTQLNVWNERYAPSAETVVLARDCCTAFDHADESREAHWILTARCSLAILLLLRGELGEAEEKMSAVMNDAARMGDLEMHARSLTYFSFIQRRRGRVVVVEQQAERSLAKLAEAGMSQYVGAVLANQAWVAFRRGDHVATERVGREALSRWEALQRVYPFQWLARMPLAFVELACGRVEGSVAQVRAMLHPKQQRLPGKIEAAFTAADEAFAQGHAAEAQKILRAISRVARGLGYL